MSFCHKRTQYTPICLKIMFLCFLNFFNPVKNIAPMWANIGINWQNFPARIKKWVLASNGPNTLQYVQKSCFGAFLNFFITDKNIAPVWANIGINWHKFAARITRWVFATNATNTLNYVLKSCFGEFLNYFIPVKNITPVWANIGINCQKFAARITKWVFATNAPNTLQ